MSGPSSIAGIASGIGILGVGTHLPPEVRTNDWWRPEVVARWMQGRERGLAALREAPPAATPAMRAIVGAMLELGGDPFGGVVERRVLAADATATDMETAAAEIALARAGIDRDAVDLLLVHTAVPEYLLANSACVLHRRLGLPAACLALEAQASAYSFVAQLALAEAMIAAGRARHALLVQSSAASRLLDPDDPVSAVLGDAASAVIVGRVGNGGIQATVHRADGRVSNSLVASVRGGRWYDGRSVLHLADPAGERQLMLETVDRGKDVIAAVLAAAGRRAEEVAFFAVHQGTPWLRRLTQAHAGIATARTIDLFPRTGYVFAASLPLVLEAAERDGQLSPADLVLVFGGGTGITFGATLISWSGR